MSEISSARLSSKTTRRGWRSQTAVASAVFGTLFVACLVIRWSCTSTSPTQLNLLATLKPDDEFWVSERMAGTHECKTYVLPRDQGVALLRAMATAEPWEAKGTGPFSFCRGSVDPPAMKVMLVWCKDWKHRRGLRGNVLWINVRNKLINYEGSVYVVPPEAREIVNRLFQDE